MACIIFQGTKTAVYNFFDLRYDLFQPGNSHEWPSQNFSLQYQYNVKQTSDEKEEKYQLGDYKFIQSQILQTNITRTVWQTERRITNEILGVKGLILLTA